MRSSYSVLHRNLGLVAWKIDNDYWKAVACYERALACNPEDFPLYRDLASIYMNHTQQYVKACALLEKAREKKCKRADIAVLLGRAYLNLGEYGKAIAMLTGDSFTNWEGQGSLYTIYNAARIGLGEQLYRKGDYNGALREFRASVDYPQNLGAGQMDDAPDAESRYWLGMALNKLGKKAEASKEWQLAAGQSAKGDAQNIKFAKQAAEALQAH
jgi:tetratricopeptide (TPR) repeat protein